jgi:hypothetical protein
MSEQTQTIDLRFLAESQPSLCIPRVFNNITETKIRQVFDELGLGKISRIDIKERKNEKGDTVKRVYVHFEKWFWNESAQSARRKLISGKEIKIVYDNPWFWKVSASKWTPSHNNNYEIGGQVQAQQTERPRTIRIINDFEEQRRGGHYEGHYENRNNYRAKHEVDEQRNYGYINRQRDIQKDKPYRRHNERHNERHNGRQAMQNESRSYAEPRLNITPTCNVAPSLTVTPSLPHILKNSCPIVPKLQLKEKIEQLSEPVRNRNKKNVLPLEINIEEELELEEGEIKEGDVEIVEEMSEERKELLNDLYGDIKF